MDNMLRYTKDASIVNINLHQVVLIVVIITVTIITIIITIIITTITITIIMPAMAP